MRSLISLIAAGRALFTHRTSMATIVGQRPVVSYIAGVTLRRIVASAALTAALAPAARAQTATPAAAPSPSATDSAAPTRSRSHFKTRFALGFVTSILAHEAGHVIAAYAVGGHPSFGFDRARPTIYSGIDADLEPRKQFIFSSAGLTVQTLLDEAILDVPHRRGGAFERGVLTGGIATVLFYTTIGRNANVSDVSFMARTSSLSKGEVSLIYGAIAALHAFRIHRDRHYAHFFAEPSPDGRLRVGVGIRPE
jgi:hypothetical protein